MADRPTLTPRQSRILDTIRDSVRDRGYPPTLRELTAAVGISSSSTAAEQLRILQARGYIRVTPNVPRGIMVLDPIAPTPEQSGILVGLIREHRSHPQVYVCPGCHAQNLHTSIGIDKIAYTYETCDCRAEGFEFDHLIEQLWHRSCLVGSES